MQFLCLTSELTKTHALAAPMLAFAPGPEVNLWGQPYSGPGHLFRLCPSLETPSHHPQRSVLSTYCRSCSPDDHVGTYITSEI